MSSFQLSLGDSELVDIYLARLKISRTAPSLSFLNTLIHAHQERIPFENFTRVCDYRDYPLTHNPPIEDFIRRLPKGAGGVCWTLARGFGWLLKNLDFEVQYLYMDPGHVCLKVSIDEEYYVDVGYGAPFSKAWPLRQSFVVDTSAEKFEYRYKIETIDVERTPGPRKTLYLNSQHPTMIGEYFSRKNKWGENRFFSVLLVSRFENGKLLRFLNDKFQDYRTGELVERVLRPCEVSEVLSQTFGVNPDFYFRAKAILHGH